MSSQVPPDAVPSLDVVRAELDQEQASYERRAASLDGKAGLILAAAGVLVGLKSSSPTVGDIFTQLFAAAGGVAAVWAMWPRVAGALSPLLLRNKYIHRPPDATKLVALDTRLEIHQNDEKQLATKATRFKLAAALLAFAVVVSLTGSIVTVVGKGASNDQPCHQCTTPAGSKPSRTTSVPARS